MPEIKVPAVLSGGGGSSSVEVDGDTLAELFENHAAEHGPELRDSVVEDGDIKEFINVYVDGSEVSGLDTPVDSGSRIRVIPAASGGRV
ncbi:MoaD/ThiS family protein [Haloplanus pelagicus]|jgi:molybdopterin converting factor small subunit|uniref:MoaD/ThiS family protein n=1 Tax=Haloplanus pelagicus TaxID=2949995 RepID=UPI00203F5872|nr:MoaD/ThiS family protein [Haloplanus sp. HW8-1]